MLFACNEEQFWRFLPFCLLQAMPFLSPEAGRAPLHNAVADHSLCPFSNRILVIQTLAIPAQQGDWLEWAPYTSFNQEILWGLLSLYAYVGTSALPISAHSIEICQLIFLSQSWDKGKLSLVCCIAILLPWILLIKFNSDSNRLLLTKLFFSIMECFSSVIQI